MAEESIHVEAARIPDRDRLLQELQKAGLDARSVGEVCIEVPYGGDEEAAADELLAQTEHLITTLGEPFVPLKHEGDLHQPARELIRAASAAARPAAARQATALQGA